ncbi:protein phosphatase 1 regulatory subunit 12A [Culicoides brevitarsis]|uniref:protein phosphatase 1 regulatory subunit 12A n=1 Tax=Culicoides brevitarsis TaxID=469753 RepID=UPI00307BB29A
MSLDSRNNSAYLKRAEQLKRWEESDTNREPTTPKNKNPKIKFSSGCIFLAACVSGDKDEVKALLEQGADIDTTNIDGLTALHQACIDDNLDMVEFLISQGADVNRKDNEGWTPLHVTASCDLLSIAGFLIESGADLSSINSDGDLPIDLVQSDEMRNLIQKHVNEQGIDCDQAKQIEEKLMLEDAKRWLRSDASEADRPHPKTGATALHVAAAKGYTKVLSLLLAGRADVDKQDNDGWTPLHAASHWGQKEAVQMLVASMADMDILNYAGQSCIDVAQDDIVTLLEELRKNNKRTKRRPASQIRISSDGNNVDSSNAETPSKVIRVEVKTDDKIINKKQLGHISESDSESSSSDSLESSECSETSLSDRDTNDDNVTQGFVSLKTTTPAPEPVKLDKPIIAKDKDLIQQEEENTFRKPNSVHQRESPYSNSQLDKSQKVPDDKENTTPQHNSQTDSEVILRRTHSFESDEAFYTRLQELRARIKANSCSNLPLPQKQGSNGTTGNNNNNNNNNNQTNQLNNFIVQRSASLKDHKQVLLRKPTASSPPSSPISTSASASVRSPPLTAAELLARRLSSPEVSGGASAQQPPCPVFMLPANRQTTNGENSAENGSGNEKSGQSPFTKFVQGNIFKNFFKSFVPPTRDEESETQRKAHAKRVRETRRSTQGVTLEEIKSAEQLVKKKNSTNAETEVSSVVSTSATVTIPSTLQQNDRVPAVPNVEEYLKKEDSPVSSETSSASSLRGSSPPTSEQVSASYTLITPSFLRQRGSSVGSDDSEKAGKTTSVSYTIPVAAPITESVETKTTDEDSNSTVTATFKVPLPVSTRKISSDSSTEMEKSKPSPTMKSRFKWESEEKSSETEKPVPAARFNTTTSSDYGTHRSYVRDKRSIFDIDHAQLTLAEKLRIEASKYADTSRSNTDLPYSRSDSAESDTVPKKYDSVPSSPAHHTTTERRPSWRLRLDPNSKFKLEESAQGNNKSVISQAALQPSSNITIDASKMPVIPVAATRRIMPVNNTVPNATTVSTTINLSNARPISSTAQANDQKSATPTVNSNATATDATLPSTRQRLKAQEEVKENANKGSENDKENDSRSAQNTQALIQRRRRPKRRSTGVVHLDGEDPENDKESGGESGRVEKDDSSENGEFIDYKALYEAEKAENDKNKEALRKKDEELATLKSALERFTNATTKNTLSEIEKRERRAMERKISEMEEELKQMETLKADNQRLKDENGALIRVISKLSK